jgi:hypothetical protein
LLPLNPGNQPEAAVYSLMRLKDRTRWFPPNHINRLKDNLRTLTFINPVEKLEDNPVIELRSPRNLG